MKRPSFGSLKRLFACLSVPREVVSCLLPGSLDLSFQKFALGHVVTIETRCHSAVTAWPPPSRAPRAGLLSVSGRSGLAPKPQKTRQSCCTDLSLLRCLPPRSLSSFLPFTHHSRP